jgi:hypothetical protein
MKKNTKKNLIFASIFVGAIVAFYLITRPTLPEQEYLDLT